MKSIKALAVMLLLSQLAIAQNFWQPVEDGQVPPKNTMTLTPTKYGVISLNDQRMAMFLAGITNAGNEATISLPTPGGAMRSFRIWSTPVMEEALAKKYPAIQTFTIVAVNNPLVTGKLDITEHGFHAMVIDGKDTWFIDPYN